MTNDHLTIQQLQAMLTGILKPGGIISVPSDWQKFPELVNLLSVCRQMPEQLIATMQREAKLRAAMQEILERLNEHDIHDTGWIDLIIHEALK